MPQNKVKFDVKQNKTYSVIVLVLMFTVKKQVSIGGEYKLKHYKEIIDELTNKMDEKDGPNKFVDQWWLNLKIGGIKNVIKMMKKEQGDEQDKITKKISKMIKG